MRKVASVVALALLAVVPTASAAPTTGRLLVTLERPSTARAHAAAATAVAARNGARPVRSRAVPEIGLLTVKPRSGGGLRALAGRLRDDPRVRKVQVEGRARFRAQPNDPAQSTPETAPGTPPGTPVQWWLAREGFPRAWDFTRGDGAVVAVIDSGVDGSHPELAGKLRRAVDVDDDPSHGPATVDESGHGTHVSSFACGATDNGVGFASAGHNCTLIVEKTDLTDSSVARAIVDATNAGAEAINMSFGTDGRTQAPQALVDAIDFAYSRGVVLVAAAADQPVTEQGDPSNVVQPTNTGANLDAGKGLSVTAANFSDRRAPFAGLGSQISIAAYGTFDQRTGPDGLLGAWPANQTDIDRGSVVPPVAPCRCRVSFGGDTRYAYLQGTSMAAPMVAGAAALVRHLNPDLSAAEVIRLMKETARRPEGTGWTPELGWGILDAGAAVDSARRIDRRAPSSSIRAPRTTRSQTVTLRLRSADAAPPGVTASGVSSVRVLRSANGGALRRIATTSAATLRLRLKRGSSYTFLTQAVDAAGNVEALPGAPDARTRVARAPR